MGLRVCTDEPKIVNNLYVLQGFTNIANTVQQMTTEDDPESSQLYPCASQEPDPQRILES